jgi:hypothetical protein
MNSILIIKFNQIITHDILSTIFDKIYKIKNLSNIKNREIIIIEIVS